MEKAIPKISVEYVSNAVVVTITSEKILEESEIRSLEQSVMPLIENNDKIHLVIDFQKVKFLTSAVLGLLIRISKKVYESKGQLGLCSISPKIFDIFRITRLDKVFEIYQTQEEAIRGSE